jgi:vacuolar-type H+-ATPase subunit H
VSETVEPSVNGALTSVRQLERALEAASTKRAASEARVEKARADASRLLASARAAAADVAAERRRIVLGAADVDAAEISRQADEQAVRLRADAAASRGLVVKAALALILPAADASEA